MSARNGPEGTGTARRPGEVWVGWECLLVVVLDLLEAGDLELPVLLGAVRAEA